MAKAPGHKFGQDLGKLLEDVVLNTILKPRLLDFAHTKNYYLDWQKKRSARPGKKVTWTDKYGNTHDLDFVIEAGGTEKAIGKPLAFIEAAWRRYTKHSKNKAQEIQGALLPIVELHHLSAPFYGAVLAGDFTVPALKQLRNNNFSVLYIPYKHVVEAFASINFDIAFDEDTPHEIYVKAIKKLENLTPNQLEKLKQALKTVSESETNKFMTALKASLERVIKQICIIPLFGERIETFSVEDALEKLKGINTSKPSGELQKIEVIVDYDNGDTIRASFSDRIAAEGFLKKLEA